VNGIEVARGLFVGLVRPILAQHLPGLRYAAGRIGSGSDVLGLDDEVSRDHDWGNRLTLLVDDTDRAAVPIVDGLLARELPVQYRGRPIRQAMTWDPVVRHRVQADTIGDFATSRLGLDPTRELSTLDWLTLPGHSVLEVVGGPLFADDTTQVGPARARLRWYPSDVDRYVLAVGWDCLARHVPIHSRSHERGFHRQSRLLAGAMATELTRLAFLVGRSWIPYDKWVEARFRDLPVAPALSGPLDTLVTAPDGRDRDEALALAVEVLLDAQRQRDLPTPDTGLEPFYRRAHPMISPDITERLLASITDPAVLALPTRLGSIEQWAVRHDVVFQLARRPAIVAAYRAWLASPEPPIRG
jgi:hypothetical protein